MLQAVRLLTELARPAENNHHHHHHHHHHNHNNHHHHHRRESEVTMESGQQAASSSSSSSVQSVGTEGSVQFREIYKNGWLRRTDKTDKETNRFWVAFCVHDDTEPRLEGFADQKQATTHSPIWANSLRGIQHLSPTLCATQRHDYEFCVNFSDDRVLRLASPTYQGMLDWVQLITRKLTDMKILRPKENLYSKGPERIATRDPTSPLPPPPLSTGLATPQQASPPVVTASSSSPSSSTSIAGTSASSNNTINVASTSSTTSNSSTSSPGREPGTSVETAPMVFTFDDISLEERRAVRPTQGQVQRAAPPTPSPRIVPAVTTSDEANVADSGYESIFMASSYSPTGDSARAARDIGQNSGDSSNERYAALMEYRSSTGISNNTSSNNTSSNNTSSNNTSSNNTSSNNTSSNNISSNNTSSNNTSSNNTSSNNTSLDSNPPPRPQQSRTINNSVEPRQANSTTSNVRRQLTLREQQVFQLRREMAHPAGVRLLLGRRDCKDSIAFVDTYGAVWVAGWKQREHPLLYNVLHVGDLVLSVAGITPLGAAAIRDILKSCTTPRVEVIVRRLPYARAVTLTKRNDTDDFGLEVNGNEVSGVSGVALSLGLPPLATATDPTAPSGSNTTWTLTEMNGKPLNIFDGGACERFRAVGRDISIVIQPTDLVSSLRKKLRSIRSYKNFVMQ